MVVERENKKNRKIRNVMLGISIGVRVEIHNNFPWCCLTVRLCARPAICSDGDFDVVLGSTRRGRGKGAGWRSEVAIDDDEEGDGMLDWSARRGLGRLSELRQLLVRSRLLLGNDLPLTCRSYRDFNMQLDGAGLFHPTQHSSCSSREGFASHFLLANIFPTASYLATTGPAQVSVASLIPCKKFINIFLSLEALVNFTRISQPSARISLRTEQSSAEKPLAAILFQRFHS